MGGKEGLYGASTVSPPDGNVYHYATTSSSSHYQGVYAPSPVPMYAPATTTPHMYSPAPMYTMTPGMYSTAAATPNVAAYNRPEGCFYHLSKPDSLQNIAAGLIYFFLIMDPSIFYFSLISAFFFFICCTLKFKSLEFRLVFLVV
jgi:hypothetical protein